MRTLPDYLRKGMRMILVGANPGDRSARVGHYYAGRGNQFWPIMYESGVIPEPLSYEDDRRILEFGIGMTDLVKRPMAKRRTKNSPAVPASSACKKKNSTAHRFSCCPPPAA
jgi:mismatch-specific thymine-DNA glycosylase